MLMQRVITAAVLLALLTVTLMLPQRIFFELFILAFVGAAFWEWLRLNGHAERSAIALAVAGALAMFFLWTGGNQTVQQVLWWAAAGAWLIVAIPPLRYGLVAGARIRYSVLAALILSASYVAVEALFAQKGAVYLLSVFLIVWIADIAGYFFGKTFGRHKLAPSISPGKTVEGAAGALFSVAAYCLLCVWVGSVAGQELFPAALQAQFGLLGALLAVTGLCLASISGDLMESLLKRRAGAKDSSRLLPGHGGVLDRIDALLPVLPVAALFTFV
jgi:phosphatidate cytidylyltransferase